MVGAATPAQAQTLQWVRQFGTAAHDIGYTVTTDTTGNIYVGGVTRGALPAQTSAGNGDAFVARFDASGGVIWVRQFGTSQEDGIVESATDAAGAVFVAGFTGGQTSIAGTTGLLAKYDSAGNRLWTREFTAAGFSTSAIDVDTDAAGNVYVLLNMGNVSGQQWSLAKYTAEGAPLWSRPLDASLNPTRLATDTSGHVYLVGRTASDAFVAQYDDLGNQVWVRPFGTPSLDTATDVATNALGDVYVVGLQDGYDLEASFIARYDAAGDQNWVRTFTADDFAPWAMAVTADDEGNTFIGGFVWGTFGGEPTAGRFDAFVVQYDRAGTQGSVRLFGTSETEDVRGISVDSSGNIHVAGTTDGTFPGEIHQGVGDVFLARLTLPQVGLSGRITEAMSTLAGLGLAHDIQRSLAAKLAAAQRAADAGSNSAACGPLNAFANEVSALAGKKLTADQAALLRSAIGLALSAGACTSR
jgi:hypothetical protein